MTDPKDDSKAGKAEAGAEARAGHTSSIEDQIKLREDKARAIRAAGGHPYGNAVPQVTSTATIRARHESTEGPALEASLTETYFVAGRVVSLRSMGKVTFIALRDGGGDLQLFLRANKVGAEAYESLKSIDLGDIVCCWGRALKTKTGELSIGAGEAGSTPAPSLEGHPARPAFQLLTKSVRPLPGIGWYDLEDVETRYRQRYVDLAVHLDVRQVFLKRARIISGIRRFLDERGYLEVETPVLHKPEEAGGAAARPFETHHNALDLDLKLRIATELHLKRLVVGGFERVYEIGRIFRNEGIDRRHNPEFTSIEFYQAYATYEDLMRLTEEMVSELAVSVTGNSTASYQGAQINYGAPWPRVSMVEEVAKKLLKESASQIFNASGPRDPQLSAALDALSQLPDSAWQAAAGGEAELTRKLNHTHTLGAKIAWAFEALVEHELPKDRPCFVIDFPLEVSPLARKRDAEPRLVDRFEAYAGGMEIANAFSELNDPRDQEARFQAQVEAAARGDAEAMPYDRDFVRALEHGMPPTAGEGIGIDRLAMLFTDSATIREVVLFPLLKPHAEAGDATSIAAAEEVAAQAARPPGSHS